jgi:hypothetical protein
MPRADLNEEGHGVGECMFPAFNQTAVIISFNNLITIFASE